MSYWYDFDNNGGFKIHPPAPQGLIDEYSEDNDSRSGYWIISEDGTTIELQEPIGGNNSGFEEELEDLCDDLMLAGCVANGRSAFCGEETIYSEVGIVTIKDNNVTCLEFGDLASLLYKWEESE